METGHVPNFVAVDFYEHGDLFEVVDALNPSGFRATGGVTTSRA